MIQDLNIPATLSFSYHKCFSLSFCEENSRYSFAAGLLILIRETMAVSLIAEATGTTQYMGMKKGQGHC
jgi:hypothetical protein